MNDEVEKEEIKRRNIECLENRRSLFGAKAALLRGGRRYSKERKRNVINSAYHISPITKLSSKPLTVRVSGKSQGANGVQVLFDYDWSCIYSHISL